HQRRHTAASCAIAQIDCPYGMLANAELSFEVCLARMEREQRSNLFDVFHEQNRIAIGAPGYIDGEAGVLPNSFGKTEIDWVRVPAVHYEQCARRIATRYHDLCKRRRGAGQKDSVAVIDSGHVVYTHYQRWSGETRLARTIER